MIKRTALATALTLVVSAATAQSIGSSMCIAGNPGPAGSSCPNTEITAATQGESPSGATNWVENARPGDWRLLSIRNESVLDRDANEIGRAVDSLVNAEGRITAVVLDISLLTRVSREARSPSVGATVAEGQEFNFMRR
jgi:hypothetical protein